jgi:hypothetical protein
MTTITRSYDDFDDAKAAVTELKELGVPESDISLIANRREDVDEDSATDGMAKGAGIGGALGAATGLLTGLGLLAIPGLGPVVAAGWLASTALGTAAGAVAGAAAGGLIDALTSSGVDERDAHAFAESVRRGAVLVSVRVPEPLALRAQEVLDHHDPIDLDIRRRRWEATGWSGFDPDAAPYTADQIENEKRQTL